MTSRSHDALIRVFDDAGNVIETHQHKGDFQRVVRAASPLRFTLVFLSLSLICSR